VETGQKVDGEQVFRSQGLNRWIAACWCVFLVIGLSMLFVSKSTVVERVIGGAVVVLSVWMIRSSLRREVRVDAEGFEFRQIRTRRVPWNRLQGVWVGRSGVGYGVRVKINGDRFPRQLPVGALGKPALQDNSIVVRLASVLRGHLPPAGA